MSKLIQKRKLCISMLSILLVLLFTVKILIIPKNP